MNKKSIYLYVVGILCVLGIGGFFLFAREDRMNNSSVDTEVETVEVAIDFLSFQRKSKTEIELSWLDEYDLLVDTYILKKRTMQKGLATGEWQIVDTIKSDGISDGKEWIVVDVLDDVAVQQFEYRVDVELAITKEIEHQYEAVEGTPILASNVKVCIDPGHFYKPGEVTEVDEYAYVEGNFMLEVALGLKERIKKQYGIDVCLTRDSDVIELDGYRDEELDSAHISLRGEYAAIEDCDLFVSLHSNSNKEDANGCETFYQPKAINKSIIIVNTYGLEVEYAIKAANAIGTKLSSVNFELGLADTDAFCEVTKESIGEWTQDYNDGLGEVGTVVIRTGKKTPDYYGVLRGATNVEVPGIIIEHGYHSVAEVRQAAANGDLKEVWANADACGIAYGFGFTQ